MFTLKVHKVSEITVLSTSSSAHNGGLKPFALKGVAHLFRQLPSDPDAPALSTVANIATRSQLVFVVAVPNYVSPDDFILFCGNQLTYFQEILFLRDDGVEGRYSVLIKLKDQVSADGFYLLYHGKKFKPTKVEVCHIYFAQSVCYYDTANMASLPPHGYTELPSCPICLERLDFDTSGIRRTLCDHPFPCPCVLNCTYLSCPVCRLSQQEEMKPVCAVCGTFKNLGICLICGFIGCGRYEKGHANGHCRDEKHRFSLELEDHQIWDYVGDRYVHRLNQSEGARKSVGGDKNCSSTKQCGTCEYDEEGLTGALVSRNVEGDKYSRLIASQLATQRRYYESLIGKKKGEKDSSVQKAVEKAIFFRTNDLRSKLERYDKKHKEIKKKQEFLQSKLKEIKDRGNSAVTSKNKKIANLQEQILDKDNHLLASQLEIQRQHYESLLSKKKSEKDTLRKAVVENDLFSRTNDLQSKLEIYAEEKKKILDKHEELTNIQEFLQSKLNEIEDRGNSAVASKNQTISDLEAQIEDVNVYVEAQRKFSIMNDTDGVRGGNQSSSSNSNRRNKSGRRRK